MKIEEQVFTIEQTEKLIEFGFDTSNASCYYPTDASNNPYYFPAFNCGNDKRTYPAFTVCDIIDLIPMIIRHKGEYYSFAMDNICVAYESDSNPDISFCNNNSLRDNLFECIKWLKLEELI